MWLMVNLTKLYNKGTVNFVFYMLVHYHFFQGTSHDEAAYCISTLDSSTQTHFLPISLSYINVRST